MQKNHNIGKINIVIDVIFCCTVLCYAFIVVLAQVLVKDPENW